MPDINDPTTYAAWPREGWLEPAAMVFLARLALNYPRILEVGCWRGRSTLCLCEFSCGHVWTVDTFHGSPGYQDDLHRDAKHNREHYLLELGATLGPWMKSGVLTIEVGESVEVAKRLKDERFDVVFLDGDHRTEFVSADIAAWLPLVRPNGLLFGHDIGWESVQKAVDKLLPGWTRGPGVLWLYEVPK